MTATPALHATTIHFAGAGILLCGPSGAGKSDLALRLIEAGATLIADDYTHLRLDTDGRLIAHCPPALIGRLEVRGIGIVTLPHAAQATIDLGFELMARDKIERLPDPAWREVAGAKVPFWPLDPFAASAVIKVRLAVGLILGDKLHPS